MLSCSTGEPRLSDVTVQWCFITEALNPKNHSFGSLIRGCHGARYSYHHNLYAHNRNRNPRPGNYDDRNPHEQDPNGLLLDFRNNVIYNWIGTYAGYNADKDSVTKLNYVGNYVVPGPNSKPTGIAYQEGSPYNKGYFAGNYYDHNLPETPGAWWTSATGTPGKSGVQAVRAVRDRPDHDAGREGRLSGRPGSWRGDLAATRRRGSADRRGSHERHRGTSSIARPRWAAGPTCRPLRPRATATATACPTSGSGRTG